MCVPTSATVPTPLRTTLLAVAAAWLLLATTSLVGPAPAAADDRGGAWVYTTPGQHSVNGREWRTTCESYSSTVWRCRTDILADTVVRQGDRFVERRDFVFNNLTYLASPRQHWAGNPLGEDRTWTGDDGRRWRTECDTAATGRNGCRTWAEATVVGKEGGRYVQSTRMIFNNIVLFGSQTNEPGTAPVPYESRELVGHSVQGREIWAYQVGDPNASKVTMVLGQMHGEEPAGTLSAWGLINDHRQVQGIQLWVIPSMNPDGGAIGRRQNAGGVDLNRNWPVNYESNAPGTRYYAGTGPMSEPETAAMAAFIQRIQPHQMVSIHQPLTGVDNYGLKDRSLHDALVRELGLPSRSLDCNGGCRGTMTQWINTTTRGAAITIEYPLRVSDHYASVTARDGLVRALGGTYR